MHGQDPDSNHDLYADAPALKDAPAPVFDEDALATTQMGAPAQLALEDGPLALRDAEAPPGSPEAINKWELVGDYNQGIARRPSHKGST